LAAGGLAALLASACCLGPLMLISVGISGAWIANLTALEPYRPAFIGVGAIALVVAWRRIWRPAAACAPGEACAATGVRRAYKILFVVAAGIMLTALLFPYAAPWFY